MFCKQCGKEIDDNSNFCNYCGSTTYKPVKKLTRKNIIANEIVINFKMIILAIILSAIYSVGFIIYHQKDIAKPEKTSDYGKSCYDGSVGWDYEKRGYFTFDEEYHRLLVNLHNTGVTLRRLEIIANRRDSYSDSDEKKQEYNPTMTTKQLEKELGLSQKSINKWKYQAMINTTNARNDFCESVQYYREINYEIDLKNSIIKFTFVSLILLIIGRYLLLFVFLSIKWVLRNKTT